MKRIIRWCLCLMASAAAGGGAVAQELLHAVTGSSVGDDQNLGAALGDVDGDGFDDFAVSARRANALDGAAWIYSGRTGGVLHSLGAPVPRSQFGSSLAALDDTDGDGIRDLLVGAPYVGRYGELYLFSGRTGALLWMLAGTASGSVGYDTSPAGDLDLDGAGDFVTGRGAVHSGVSGALLFRLPVSGSAEFAAIPDLNGDGHDDLLCGLPDEDGLAGEMGAGRVQAYSGKDGSLLFEHGGQSAGDRLGRAVDVVGDLDGDGLADYLAGADGFDGLFADAGVLYVFSSATQSVLFQFEGPGLNAAFGRLASAVGDVNGDGVGDFAVAAWPPRAWIHLYSGRTGQLLYRFSPSASIGPGMQEFATLGPAGDVNNDGLADILRGGVEYWYPVGGATTPGTVRIFAGNDLWLDPLLVLSSAGPALELTIREGVPASPSLLAVVAVNGAPLFLGVGGLTLLDGSGSRRVRGDVPPALSGSELTFQAFGLGPTGIAAASARIPVSLW